MTSCDTTRIIFGLLEQTPACF